MIQAAPTLTTARLTLRQPQAGDLPAYSAYCVSDRTAHVGGPYSDVQAFDKFAAMIGHWTLRGFGRYVILHEGRAIGHAGPLAMDVSHAPEMTWTLWTADAEGQGLATEAAKAVVAHLFNDLQMPALIVRIAADNAASHKMAVRLGATPTDDPAPHWLPGARTYWLRAKVNA
ncbi:GNAT family N-acetyltransferase [Anianabacter salinae]|uniref:GNAT family N-acetyltransferase n=1 Tax=Anianabacter salinae TaxID=2851023 RepID=UPI00225E17EA|nr:GNAT family N-acetyltransferase [Anianabacter salinae]MBV0910964.1 GNAT family N-acetyltransferase [Anianabacter salinae]